MNKKSGKRKKTIEKRLPKKELNFLEKMITRRSLPYKILNIFIILLIFLILAWTFIYILSNLNIKESYYQEEDLVDLGTLCIFCEENLIELDVLGYLMGLENETAEVNINWSSGNINIQDFKSILVEFKMNDGKYCNSTINSNLPSFGNNKSYIIDSFNLGCSQVDFSNVSEIFAYAETDIHLTQIKTIPTITFYKDDPRENILGLNEYFNALIEINYSIIESPVNDKIEIMINNVSKKVSISLLDSAWSGTQRFNITAYTAEGDMLNTNNQGTNMTFSIIAINSSRPLPNHPPSFNSSACPDIELEEKEVKYSFNISKCFYDEDGDTLNFRYSNFSNISRMSLSNSSYNVALTKLINWTGVESFLVYANDSKEEVGHKIDVEINKFIDSSSNITKTNTTNSSNPPILYVNVVYPAGDKVHFFKGEPINFSISNKDYDSINWYVDEVLVKSNSKSYGVNNFSLGNHTVKVEVKKGSQISSKVWQVVVEDDEYGYDNIFEVGEIVFYTIIVILLMVILLVIWLFIEHKNNNIRKNGLGGFGIEVTASKGQGSTDFNIPK